ncbi:DUF4238 domain-containing protein [Parageobacillus sp. KH3-4]|uniref:DUF4238 domain-containing protein n=1 Tax=Parageobacillus sp. KH3-4 TaxID=2916802 RepID=UPI002112DC44|nr:DUF4238 domain-containing protein [Parageobacillus sp. KH3-4]
MEDMLMKIENQCSKIINTIIRTSRIPPKDSEDYHLLLLFLLLSEARNLKTADSIDNFINRQIKIIAKMDERINVPDDIIDKMTISMTIPNLNPIKASLELYPILLDLGCVLLLSKNDRQFITSDNPLVRYNQMYVQRNYTLRGYGLGNMGIQLFFPISPKMCICLFDHILYDYTANEDGIIEIHNGKQIDEINKLFYLNSYAYLFFNENVKESYINRLIRSCNKHSISQLDKEIQVLGDKYNKLIAYSPRKVTERIKLSFFKIRKEFIKMPLPVHMGGPMRPYAKKFTLETK